MFFGAKIVCTFYLVFIWLDYFCFIGLSSCDIFFFFLPIGETLSKRQDVQNSEDSELERKQAQ